MSIETTTADPATNALPTAWAGFTSGPWQDAIDVRDFIQRNYTPYAGDDSFLVGPTERTTRVWNTLAAMFPEERAKGIYDADPHTPAAITAHGPGYISEDDTLIVGLQTDAPLKRAIMPNGGWRMVEGALETYGYEVDQTLKAVYTYQRKTHNQGVFDVYPPSVRAARSSHIITGLPDAYGRGRIIGDYRRVALYGVDALIQAKKLDKLAARHHAVQRGSASDARGAFRAAARPRRAEADGGELRHRHLRPGDDGPRSGAVAVLRLSGCGEGAERRRDVARAHLDVPRRLHRARPRGRRDHRAAGAGADRRLRHQAAHRPVPAHAGVRRAVLRRPDLGDGVDRRHGRGRSFSRHEELVPLPADPLQPRSGARAEHDGVLEFGPSPRASRTSARACRSTRPRCSTSPTT